MPHDGGWVDEFLLAGADQQVCLRFESGITRRELRREVADRAAQLREAGLRPGGTVSLRLPPGLTFVVTLLAAWRVGAQVSLLDHRLTEHEVGMALTRIRPELVVAAPGHHAVPLRGHVAVVPQISRSDGAPAASEHALIQLSSGSTGPSKMIGRTATDLRTEIGRYRQLSGVPQPDERLVLLSSMVHVLGLVGGLLYCLHAGTQLVIPRTLSTAAIREAVLSDPSPATVIGVPFHIDFLSLAGEQGGMPPLTRMTVGGELVRPAVRDRFLEACQVPLGVMYGMTEVGVIATDLAGETWPELAPVPGMQVREQAGELLLGVAASPYLGLVDPHRWHDGWLHTRDAGTVDTGTGRLTVRGRLDSQVSVGGLKVDLNEVEQTLAELPEVAEVVVAHDGAIEAFVALSEPEAEPRLRAEMARRLAPYKRPRRVNLVDRLPRTATGKLVRSVEELRRATGRTRERAADERSSVDVH